MARALFEDRNPHLERPDLAIGVIIAPFLFLQPGNARPLFLIKTIAAEIDRLATLEELPLFKLQTPIIYKVQALTVKGHVWISISWLGKLVPRRLHQALADYKFHRQTLLKASPRHYCPGPLSTWRSSTSLPQQLRRAGRLLGVVLALSSGKRQGLSSTYRER